MLVALLGSGEYLPVMDEVDRHLLKRCGPADRPARVVCLPTAAGQEGEGSVSRWMEMGERHFRRLGAAVSALHLTCRDEAEDPRLAAQIAAADLVYLSGGNPHYLFATLNGSAAWAAAGQAFARGAACAGCSAGAMILGAALPNWRSLGGSRAPAFGMLPGCTILPHFDRLLSWRGLTLPILQTFIRSDEYVLGLDEETALVGTPGEVWQVMGRSQVHVITRTGVSAHTDGQPVTLPM